MTATKLAGRGGKVRVGCTCNALTDEECKCEGVQRLILDRWSFDPDTDVLASVNFICDGLDTSEELQGMFSGTWDDDGSFHASLRRLVARAYRRLRKRWARYQRQKRKQ